MTIIEGEELHTKGMGGIFGVGKQALSQPKLVILRYNPEGAKRTYSLVGKGIMYDTGGLALKAKSFMVGMKRDCGGAAAVLGAFYASVSQQFTQTLNALFCLAENAIGPIATRPDDIHTLYSGLFPFYNLSSLCNVLPRYIHCLAISICTDPNFHSYFFAFICLL